MKLTPLADNVLLKSFEAEEKTASGIILSTATKEKSVVSEVVAAGPGTADVKMTVKKGDKVKAGQVIGLTGRTGRATTEHLHFEVSFDGKRLDPAIIFDHSNHKLKAATLHLTKGKGVKSVKN